MEILDCTLRDGSHAVTGGFSAEAAAIIVDGLLHAGVKVVEFGKASGIGSPKGNVTDAAYLEAVASLIPKGEIGMFCRPEYFGVDQLELAKQHGIGFLRVGTDADSVDPSASTLDRIRSAGIKARYSLIQSDKLTPKELAENAAKVASYGAQVVTIMDSTGTMLPSQVKEYVSALVDSVDVPVGFHGHNNLGLSIANAIAAMEAGASSLDGALMGLARSAGNAPTEMIAAVLNKLGRPTSIDLFKLLNFISETLPTIVKDAPGVQPLDLIFGYSSFHSKNLPVVKNVAVEEGVPLFKLIAEVSRECLATIDEKAVHLIARRLKGTL